MPITTKAKIIGLLVGIASFSPFMNVHAQSAGTGPKHQDGQERHGFTRTVIAGNAIYFSSVASQTDTGQLTEVYDRFQKVLKGYGLSNKHLTKATIFTRSMGEPNRSDQQQSATWIQIAPLSGQEDQVELDIVANIPASPSR